ncbi:MAG TPA: UDP-N-acetylmuramoyl-tripeptide--D-alanyl-D-alanine ligase [Bacteroidaceae bacterium]|nr:UDP-N-acetylmuramoyl-tripeptide--D-alanyl-D-alanine ligase [Bacteroidaceae bacterium]
MDIKELYSLFQKSAGVTTDSRQCKPNMIFFALRGENFNGNEFAGKAIERGCLAAIIDDCTYFNPVNSKLILVDNVLKCLQALAKKHRQIIGLPIIGITGTNGKTTTKELIAGVLGKFFNIIATEGNLNNSIGVPLSLLKIEPKHEYAIVEMGASHRGDIEELVNITEPNYGIITNVGKAHLQGFGSLQNIIATKSELFNYLRDREKSIVFINGDDTELIRMASGLNLFKYGACKEINNYHVNGCVTANNPFMQFIWRVKEGPKHLVNTKLVGSYNITNVLAAVAVGLYMNVPEELINLALSQYEPKNNRSQLIITKKNRLIVDSYNANPSSMEAAIENFYNSNLENKMIILGDMRELGESSLEEHKNILNSLYYYNFSDVFLVGSEFTKAGMDNSLGFRYFLSADDVKFEFSNNPVEGRSILIKGSNSINLSQLSTVL